ncbi:CocE/NonD family hydrolase C-terminal non-catalytic domain-containing protein [Arthrobacter sp. B2a2-09]
MGLGPDEGVSVVPAGDDEQSWLLRVKPVELDIDMWATSNVFLPGHRIRLEISSLETPGFSTAAASRAAWS